ncbi:MAG: hypothetical protein ACFFCI_14025 [Promethearchaeota archaeon]
MSKIPKDQVEQQKSKSKRRFDDKFAYRTVIISTILGLAFYIISLLFNIGIITIFSNVNTLFDIIEGFIKVGATLLFFLLMVISIGNYKELTGKPLGGSLVFLLFLLSLGQTIMNTVIFILTFIGLLIFLIYMYLVQE